MEILVGLFGFPFGLVFASVVFVLFISLGLFLCLIFLL